MPPELAIRLAPGRSAGAAEVAERLGVDVGSVAGRLGNDAGCIANPYRVEEVLVEMVDVLDDAIGDVRSAWRPWTGLRWTSGAGALIILHAYVSRSANQDDLNADVELRPRAVGRYGW